jgi:hypothetical protein
VTAMADETVALDGKWPCCNHCNHQVTYGHHLFPCNSCQREVPGGVAG